MKATGNYRQPTIETAQVGEMVLRDSFGIELGGWGSLTHQWCDNSCVTWLKNDGFQPR